MSARTKGSLCGFTIYNETAYGTTGSDSYFGGVLTSLETPDDETLEYDQGCGTRQWINVVPTMQSFGWKADFTEPSGDDRTWPLWFMLAMGALDGSVPDDLPSFCALFRIGSDEWMQSTGCKVNGLTVSADAFGSVLKWKVDAMAKKNTFLAVNTLTPEIRPDSRPVTYGQKWQRNGTAIPVKSWTLSISNSLVGDPGLDSDGKGLAAGDGSVPGGSTDITLELTVTSTGNTWDLLKQTGTDDDTLTLSIDGFTLTASGCFLRTDYPNRSQSPYDETIAYIVKTLTLESEE